VINGDIDAVKALIESGVDLDVKNSFGLTALQLAVHRPISFGDRLTHRADCALALIAAGADINHRTEIGTALSMAIRSGMFEVVNALLKRGDIDVHIPDHQGKTPLHHAVGMGKLDVVQRLLDLGANIETVAGDGYAPITDAFSFAVNNATPENTRMLDFLKAKVNNFDWVASCPPHLLLKTSFLQQVTDLSLEKGGPNIFDLFRNTDGNHVLLQACVKNTQLNVLKWIFDHDLTQMHTGYLILPVEGDKNLFQTIITSNRFGITIPKKIDLLRTVLASRYFQQLPNHAKLEHMRFLRDNIGATGKANFVTAYNHLLGEVELDWDAAVQDNDGNAYPGEDLRARMPE